MYMGSKYHFYKPYRHALGKSKQQLLVHVYSFCTAPRSASQSSSLLTYTLLAVMLFLLTVFKSDYFLFLSQKGISTHKAVCHTGCKVSFICLIIGNNMSVIQMLLL